MKAFFLITVFMQFALIGHTQRVTITADKQNIMYVGVDNPITVVAEGYTCRNTIVTIEGGSITQGNVPCSFNVRFSKPGLVNAKVYTITKRNHEDWKMLYQTTFRVKEIPDPTASIGGVSFGEIKKKVLEVQMGIVNGWHYFDFAPGHVPLIGYAVFIARNGISIYNKDCRGEKFDTETIQAFKTLKKGDKVVFYNITAKMFNDSIRVLNPVDLTIIE